MFFPKIKNEEQNTNELLIRQSTELIKPQREIYTLLKGPNEIRNKFSSCQFWYDRPLLRFERTIKCRKKKTHIFN